MLSKRKIADGQTEPEGVGIALSRVDSMMNSMLEYVNATEYNAWITGGKTFRDDIYPAYKATRKDTPKPEHLIACQEHMLTEWSAKVAIGVETDDEIVMAHDPDKTVICSNDKDFRANAFGYHYNFTLPEEHRKIDYITPNEVDYNFMIQMLMGDRADNIIGPFGFDAKVTTRKFIDSHVGLNYEAIVELAYTIYKPGNWRNLNYRLLRLLRSRDELVYINQEKETNQYPEWESDTEQGQEGEGNVQSDNGPSIIFGPAS